MNKILLTFLSVALIGISSSGFAQSSTAGTTVDQVVAVVNDQIVLKSDVDQWVVQDLFRLRRSNQEVDFSKDMWYSALRALVNRKVMLEQAKLDSVVVTNEQVDQQINQRIDQYVAQLGSEAALEEQLGKSLVQIRADLRDSYREEMIVGQLQQQKRSEITITRPEVKAYFEQIPADSLPAIPEQVAVSQIVAIPPPLENAREEAYNLAKQLRDSLLHHGKTIEELARKYSDGPAASDGGKLPMIPINDLVPEYSAAAAALQPGEISKVVETSFGFHVIRLNKRMGDKIDTNHILISIDKDSYDSQAAINKLQQLRDSVLTHKDVTFAQLARKYSEDPNTSPLGGRLLNPQTGERLIPLSQLDPALYRIVLLLDEGDISEPKEYNIGSGSNVKEAYRIVRLDQRIPEHIANLEQDFDRIQNAALQEKQYRIMQDWISNLKESMYVEYKIPVPEQFKKS